jgi:hypothetical protein
VESVVSAAAAAVVVVAVVVVVQLVAAAVDIALVQHIDIQAVAQEPSAFAFVVQVPCLDSEAAAILVGAVVPIA